ncbi:MAG: hypothetical protein QM490_00625 [Candidatus Gracilibacteria bacterium]
MSKKNIFILAAGYIAGGIISSFYNKKKPAELKKDLEKSRKEGEGDFKVMLNNFIDTHSNLLDDLKSHILTEKNKKIFKNKKEELLGIVDIYKKQGLELTEELKTKGKIFLSEASEKLENLYEEKKEEIKALKDVAPEKANKIKESLKETYEDIKNKVK